jgi:hypothetical protein
VIQHRTCLAMGLVLLSPQIQNHCQPELIPGSYIVIHFYLSSLAAKSLHIGLILRPFHLGLDLLKIATSVMGQELAYLPSATGIRRLYCSNERFGNFHKTSLTNLIAKIHTSVLHFPAMADGKFSEWWWRSLQENPSS